MNFGTVIKSVRSFSFPLSILPVPLATAAALPVREWKLDLLFASMVGVMLFHAAGNLLNDYYDFRSGVDRRVNGDENRPGRVLVKGILKPSDILNEVIICLLALIPVISYIIFRSSLSVLYFGAAALIGLYIYTGPPFKIKYRALGDLLIMLVFGPILMTGAAFAQTGKIAIEVVLLSIPIGIFTTAVVFGNSIRDLEEDAQASILTLPGRLGKKLADRFFVAGIFFPPVAVLVMVALHILPLRALLTLITIIPALFLSKKLLSIARIPDIDSRTAQLATVFIVLLFIGILKI